jgi:hypothetical protein
VGFQALPLFTGVLGSTIVNALDRAVMIPSYLEYANLSLLLTLFVHQLMEAK